MDDSDTSENFRSRTGRERRARTRAKILEALFTIADDIGVRGLTVDSLRTAAGLSRGAFYNYYDTLDDCLKEVSILITTVIHEERGGLTVDEDPVTQIALFYRYFVSRASSDQACAAVVLRTLEGGRIAVEALANTLQALFSRALAAGQIDVASVPFAVEMAMGLLWTTLGRGTGNDPGGHRLDDSMTFLLRGLGVAQPQVDQLVTRDFSFPDQEPLRGKIFARDPVL